MTDLFDDQSTTLPTVDETKNYLTELVGEGKKFKTAEDLAKGKAEADNFISQLETEMKDLRKEISARLTLEQLADKLADLQERQQLPGNRDTNDDNRDNDDQSPKTPDLKNIEELLDKRISLREQARIRENNKQYVQSELKKTFGDNYASKITTEAKQLGLGSKFLNNLAEEEPTAFLKLFSTAKQNVEVHTPPNSSVVSGFKPSSGDRTQAYYTELKKENPKAILSATVQKQMHDDAIRLGEKFFV